MEKNLKEEQTAPFLDQMMSLQKAHRAQRDEDSNLLEQLEISCQDLKNENSEMTTSMQMETEIYESQVKSLESDLKILFNSSELKETASKFALSASEKRLKEKQNEIEDYLIKIEDKDTLLTELNSIASANKKEISLLSDSISSLKIELQLSSNTIGQKDDEILILTKEMEGMKILFEKSEILLESQKNILMGNTIEISRLSKTLEVSELSEKKVLLKNEEIKDEIESLSVLLEITKNEAEVIKSDLIQFRLDSQVKAEKMIKLAEKSSEYEKKSFELNSRKKECEEEIVNLTTEITNLNVTITKSEEMTLSNNTEMMRLKKGLDRSEMEVIVLNDKIGSLSIGLQQSSKRTNICLQEMNNLNNKIASLSTALENTQKEIGCLSTLLIEKQSEIGLLSSALNDSTINRDISTEFPSISDNQKETLGGRFQEAECRVGELTDALDASEGTYVILFRCVRTCSTMDYCMRSFIQEPLVLFHDLMLMLSRS